jgi:hypothetical protein
VARKDRVSLLPPARATRAPGTPRASGWTRTRDIMMAPSPGGRTVPVGSGRGAAAGLGAAAGPPRLTVTRRAAAADRDSPERCLSLPVSQ